MIHACAGPVREPLGFLEDSVNLVSLRKRDDVFLGNGISPDVSNISVSGDYLSRYPVETPGPLFSHTYFNVNLTPESGALILPPPFFFCRMLRIEYNVDKMLMTVRPTPMAIFLSTDRR